MKSKTICNRLDIEEEKAPIPIHKIKKLETPQDSLDPLPDIPQKLGISVNFTVAINTVHRGSISMPIGNNTTNVKACDEKLQKKGIFAFVRDFLMKPISAIRDLISGE